MYSGFREGNANPLQYSCLGNPMDGVRQAAVHGVAEESDNLAAKQQQSSSRKASAYNAGDPGLIPGWGRSSGEGNGTPLQYCCLENPMDGGAWWGSRRVGHNWATSVHGWLMLRFDRKQQNSVKQLSFNWRVFNESESCSVVSDCDPPWTVQSIEFSTSLSLMSLLFSVVLLKWKFIY